MMGLLWVLTEQGGWWLQVYGIYQNWQNCPLKSIHFTGAELYLNLKILNPPLSAPAEQQGALQQSCPLTFEPGKGQAFGAGRAQVLAAGRWPQVPARARGEGDSGRRGRGGWEGPVDAGRSGGRGTPGEREGPAGGEREAPGRREAALRAGWAARRRQPGHWPRVPSRQPPALPRGTDRGTRCERQAPGHVQPELPEKTVQPLGECPPPERGERPGGPGPQ